MAILKKKELKREESADSRRIRKDTANRQAEEGKDTGLDLPATDKDNQGGMADDPARLENDSPAQAAKSRFARCKSRKFLFFALPALGIAVIATGLFFFEFDAVRKAVSNSAHSLKPVTSITRPVPIPDYHELLDFIVLSEVDHQKTITSFRIEVLFNSPSCYQNFKDRNVIFRDTVYAFLQRQNTSRNTPRSWQTVVEKDLLEYIKVTLPHSRADLIKLTQVENL